MQYRGTLPAVIVANLAAVHGAPALGELADLTIRGAGVRIPFEKDPALSPSDIIELTIHCVEHNWVVRTPAQVCQVRQEGVRHVFYSFDFINLGDLYSQLEDGLCSYFNRRRQQRVKPDLDRHPAAELTIEGRRVKVQVFDVSREGLGAIVKRRKSSGVGPGDEVGFRLFLPGAEQPVEGVASVRHKSPIGRADLLGLAFDQSPLRAAELLNVYVQRREVEMRRWEETWLA